jgi:hypothetical protein
MAANGAFSRNRDGAGTFPTPDSVSIISYFRCAVAELQQPAMFKAAEAL